tara:strand:+ start:2460 stop:3620 length:1161 start_codon:yes stop_codon:yes gene_type:complete
MLEEAQNIFQQHKYVHIPGFLDLDNCNQYVDEFKKLIDQGKATSDDQVPEAFSVGSCPLFDSLLEQLTTQIEQVTQKKLYPTYSYARWYKPGSELKFHLDRPSCEYSATITLGFSGNPWPILMAHPSNEGEHYSREEHTGDLHRHTQPNSITMNIGDAVIYKGQEVYHWREKYTHGEWQAQVFIHYVDQNGPHAEYKFDKRPSLAHHERRDGSFICHQAFSLEGCKNIISQFEKNEKEDALLVGNVKDKEVRDCKKIQSGTDKGLGATLTGIGLAINKAFWNFDVTHSNQAEYLVYDKEGHFGAHKDTILNEFGTTECRKLTCLLILNDDFEGGKFYIQVGKDKIYPQQTPGTVIVFPSFILHGVEPVTAGIRRSFVTWLAGPYFK